jgi:hypothetical protein
MDAKLMLIIVCALCAVAAFPSQLLQEENELDNVAIDNSNDCYFFNIHAGIFSTHVSETFGHRLQLDGRIQFSPPIPKCGYIEFCAIYSTRAHTAGSIKICNETLSSGHCSLPTPGPPAPCNVIIARLEWNVLVHST